jgi:zinc protease
MGYLLDTVDERKLANQQDVVRNERRQSIENRPYGIVTDALFRLVYPKGHPYYANVMGSHADIQAAKLDDVKAFFKQYYAPNNASLAIAGDFQAAAIKPLVEKYFGTLRRGPDVPKVTVTTPPITAERRAVVQDRIQLSRVYMAWLTPAFFKPGDAEADLVAAVLGGGPSSRLYKSLVYEKQIAQDVTAFQLSMSLGSMFQIVATVRPGHTPADVEAALDAELDRFRRDGPDETELTRAKNTFETERLEELESLGGFGGVADTLNLFNHYVGDPGYLPKYLDDHRQVSPEAAKAFASTYLAPNARVVIEAVPGTPDLGPPVPTPPAGLMAAGVGAEAVNPDEPWRATRPAPGTVRPMSLPPAQSFTLANGLTVIYQVRTDTPVASANLVLRTGGDANPPNRPGLANFAVTMLGQGTTSRDALRIADDFALYGASLGLSSTKDSTAVGTTALTRNLGNVVDLLADVSLHPNFPAEEIERQRASRLADLVAAAQSPSTLAAMAANLALYGPAHPYGYIELGTPEAVKALTRDEVQAFWKRTFVPVNAALVVSSPMAEQELRPIVEKAFGGWPAGPAPSLDVMTIRPTSSRLVIVDSPRAQQTQLIVAGMGAPRNTADYPALEVMNAVLGGLFSSRINLNLREAHGYTYGAGSQFLYRKYPGPFWVSTGVRTDATAPAVTEIFKELTRIRETPIPSDELTMARDAIVRALPDEFETGTRTVNALGGLFVYNLGLDYYTGLARDVAAVTAANAQTAARKYLNTDGMIVVAVGDRKTIEPALRKLQLDQMSEGVRPGTAPARRPAIPK